MGCLPWRWVPAVHAGTTRRPAVPPLRYLPHQGYEHAARSINEVGRMLGGWVKEQGERGA
jgi:hypothetical protein